MPLDMPRAFTVRKKGQEDIFDCSFDELLLILAQENLLDFVSGRVNMLEMLEDPDAYWATIEQRTAKKGAFDGSQKVCDLTIWWRTLED